MRWRVWLRNSGHFMSRPLIIAEVKTESPFGYKAEKSWEELFALACEVGDMVSIHTDPRWGGSFSLLREVRSLTNKPILAKGWHTTDEQVSQALDCGADWVLVVGKVPAFRPERCIVEPMTLDGLRDIPTNIRALWNSRDLQTGGTKTESFQDARAAFKGWLCQASNIHNVSDVQQGADAVLVGTHLVEFAASIEGSTWS